MRAVWLTVMAALMEPAASGRLTPEDLAPLQRLLDEKAELWNTSFSVGMFKRIGQERWHACTYVWTAEVVPRADQPTHFTGVSFVATPFLSQNSIIIVRFSTSLALCASANVLQSR